MKIETVILDKECDVTLTAYILDGMSMLGVDKRPAVIVFPGGGYKLLSEGEGEPVALGYNAAGYHAFVLHYSVDKKYTNGKPLKDYEKAYEYIMSRAAEWRIMTDKIAVIGFSAGGHLAACAATMSKYRPQAALLGYAVTLEETVKSLDMGIDEPYSQISSDSCPTFLFSTANDLIVPIKNTLMYALKLKENGVPFECHIYSKGNHGFSLATNTFINYGMSVCSRVENWFNDSVTWLSEIFDVKIKRPQDAPEGEISINASLDTLFADEGARAVIVKYFPFFTDRKAFKDVAYVSLRKIFDYQKTDKAIVDEIEKSLKEINDKR